MGLRIFLFGSGTNTNHFEISEKLNSEKNDQIDQKVCSDKIKTCIFNLDPLKCIYKDALFVWEKIQNTMKNLNFQF